MQTLLKGGVLVDPVSGLTVGLAAGDAALVGTCVEDAVALEVFAPVRDDYVVG